MRKRPNMSNDIKLILGNHSLNSHRVEYVEMDSNSNVGYYFEHRDECSYWIHWIFPLYSIIYGLYYSTNITLCFIKTDWIIIIIASEIRTRVLSLSWNTFWFLYVLCIDVTNWRAPSFRDIRRSRLVPLAYHSRGFIGYVVLKIWRQASRLACLAANQGQSWILGKTWRPHGQCVA